MAGEKGHDGYVCLPVALYIPGSIHQLHNKPFLNKLLFVQPELGGYLKPIDI
jgi:hypothetical protein